MSLPSVTFSLALLCILDYMQSPFFLFTSSLFIFISQVYEKKGKGAHSEAASGVEAMFAQAMATSQQQQLLQQQQQQQQSQPELQVIKLRISPSVVTLAQVRISRNKTVLYSPIFV